MMHDEESELKGKTVKVRLSGYPNVHEIRVEDWWDRVSGKPWHMSGVIASIMYARRVQQYGNIPTDDEVLYGHSDGLGYLFNVSEILDD